MMASDTIHPTQRAFINRCRVARLSTRDAIGEMYVVPICYALIDQFIVTPVDEKPKRRDRPLKRIRNIHETGRATVLFDYYEDDDWDMLAWVMIRGAASIIKPGDETHSQAVKGLRERYHQYRVMRLETAEMIVIVPERVTSWGV
jgi:PPOX class probable F420-dependent enzyme